MKITRCKYGHYYDKSYFRECPHCCRERGGRDEDIIIDNTGQSEVLSDDSRLSGKSLNGTSARDSSQKENDRENVKRWIGEAWDELEEILSEDNEADENKEEVTQSEYSVNNREKGDRRSSEQREYSIDKREEEDKRSLDKREYNIDRREEEDKRNLEQREYNIDRREEKTDEKSRENYMIFAAMPLKVIKNQEFCMDFCIFPEEQWETGAKMLEFKSRESIRDLKPVQIELPADTELQVLYKDEEIFKKEMTIHVENKKEFCTFPISVTDTRDRRFHMIKVIFRVKEQNIEIPLYLVPNP